MGLIKKKYELQKTHENKAKKKALTVLFGAVWVIDVRKAKPRWEMDQDFRKLKYQRKKLSKLYTNGALKQQLNG